jgi:hypothetical protein
MKTNEDYAYGLWKQKQIDRCIIGRALKDADKIAKFERTDPNPRILFVEQEPLKFPWAEFLVATALVGVCVWLACVIAEIAGK